MYRSSVHTMFQSLGEPAGWTVYAVRTGGSLYHVGLPGSARQGRRVAALRGYSKHLGRMIDVQDSDPRVGGKSLFDVPVQDWTGFSLEVGTLTTSPVVSVTLETDADQIGLVTAVLQMEAPGAERMRIAEPAPGPGAARAVAHVAAAVPAEQVAPAAPVVRQVAAIHVLPVAQPVAPSPPVQSPPTVLYPESVLVTLERAARHLANVAGGDFGRDLAAHPQMCARTVALLASCEVSLARIRRDMGPV